METIAGPYDDRHTPGSAAAASVREITLGDCLMLPDIEVGLTDQERAIRDRAHRFAEDVMRPAGRALDQLADPADVIAPDSILWNVYEKHRESGLGDVEEATAELSPLERARIRALVSEEMGWGDAGLAISFGVAGFPRTFALLSGDPELMARYASPGNREIGCWAITEPDHGSDTIGLGQPHWSDPSIRANCIATLDGDEYVIRGQKSAWVSNGTIATVAALFCTIGGDQGFRGGGVAVVPLDLPGVSRGKPLNKLGQRALNQGEIFFDEVRIPAAYMVVGREGYAATAEQILTMANAGMGQLFVGTARAAAEMAIDYAKQRVQGGKPIIEHQSVSARLFKMFAKVEAARSLARRVAYYNATQPPLLQYSIASKVTATNTAFEVASDALQIFGGNGLTKEFPIEKIMRDARASMIEDGCNEYLGLLGGARL
jgi:alkylation response protein AidB-like acyl-CoA dehydrogenase